jgi:MtrB/PioB family decaheme-associated outer membrane protein
MKNSSPLLLLATCTALSVAAGNATAAVDTSQWKCETCPFEEPGTHGTVDIGIGSISDKSARFGDYTGLNRKGAAMVAGGGLRYRGADGWYGSATAASLTPDAIALAADAGLEGRLALRLGYNEVPRYLSESSKTPLLGIGGGVLTLPPGFPATSTGTMPLAATLQATALGYKRSRLDIGATWLGPDGWALNLNARHMVRDGTQRMAGAFFVNATQLVAPVDQTTDALEASASYSSAAVQAALTYHASLFRNAQPTLTWSNPYTAGVLGSGSGQLALAPDNQFHQLQASAGWQIDARSRASADIAVGRMTQDASFLAPTLNASLAVPGLPAQSLHGRVATLNASIRLTAAPTERLRLSASLARDERDNETPSATYPSVATDMFLGPPRSNQPYSTTQDRLKIGADYRAPAGVRLAIGAEHEARQRTLQEVDTTRETTVFGRITAKPDNLLSVAVKLAHAERKQSEYRSLAWADPAENPLLRKYNMADRVRDTAGVHADLTLGKSVSIGLDVDTAFDDYPHSTIGLAEGRNIGVGFDISVALSDQAQLQLFGRADRIRSRQVGSQQFGQPDWSARNRDAADVIGMTWRFAVMPKKLEVGADLAISRSRSHVDVDTGALNPPLPTATTALENLKLFASYRLRDDLSLLGSYWWGRYDTKDWAHDGVLPASIPNLLALGEQPPQYRVHVLSVMLRYRF